MSLSKVFSFFPFFLLEIVMKKGLYNVTIDLVRLAALKLSEVTDEKISGEHKSF